MTIEIYLKRYFWIFYLVVIAVSAYFAAATTNDLIEARYLIRAQPARPHAAPNPMTALPTPPAKRHDKEIDLVMVHNVFCSSCPKWEKPVPKSEQPVVAPPVSDPNSPTKSTLPLSLLSTQLSMTNPEQHRAVIRDNSSGVTARYGVTDVLPGGPVLYGIELKRVIFNNKGTYEYIDLEGYVGPVPVAPPVAEVAPAVVDPSADPMAADLDKGIRHKSDTDYEIDRGLIDKLLGDTTTLARSARIVPSVKDNKPNGFKLYAIRPDSVYAKIGLMNGDTIQAINGYDMSTPAIALEVYTKVRTASNISVTVLRRGESKTLNYSIK